MKWGHCNSFYSKLLKYDSVISPLIFSEGQAPKSRHCKSAFRVWECAGSLQIIGTAGKLLSKDNPAFCPISNKSKHLPLTGINPIFHFNFSGNPSIHKFIHKLWLPWVESLIDDPDWLVMEEIFIQFVVLVDSPSGVGWRNITLGSRVAKLQDFFKDSQAFLILLQPAHPKSC